MRDQKPFTNGTSTFVKLFLILLSALHTISMSTDSAIERKLETEFDLREPRTFSSRNTEYLVIRNPGFKEMSHFTKDGKYIRTEPVNWERLALNYWFETRTPYSSCDMEPSGISTNFDWVLMVPCMFGNPLKPPSTIFVHNYMLPHFIESTLNFMDPSYRFVLVSAGTDLTIPRSAGDSRYHLLRGFAQGPDGGAYFQKLVNDPRLIHWFCENHDVNHAKLSTMPTGLTDEEPVKYIPKNTTLLSERPLKILVADRVRTGTGQWYDRKHVAEMCDELSEFCIRPSDNMANGVGHQAFVDLMVSVPFIACAHGGGIDPSPKAWESIMMGSIPIIQHSTLDDAYQHLPVAYVDSWEQLFKPDNDTAMRELLQGWIQALQPYYLEGSALRKRTMDRLKTAYWMEQVHHKLEEYHRLEALRHPTATATNSIELLEQAGKNSSDSNSSSSAVDTTSTTISTSIAIPPVPPNNDATTTTVVRMLRVRSADPRPPHPPRQQLQQLQ